MYQAEFVIVDDDQLTLILGNPTIQRMDLVGVQHQNVIAVNTVVQCSSQCPLSKEEVLTKYPNVFQGTGKLHGQYKLEIEEDAKPVIHPSRRVPVALKEKLKHELNGCRVLGS